MIAVSIDGAPVAPEHATISVFDRGLLYGDGLFEVLRTLRGQPVWLAEHLARLAEAARELALPLPGPLAGWIRATIARAGDVDHRVRVIVTRGPGALTARPATLT
ncbi:MAG: aminotransferase class IV, partial [Acidobacteriota bacterium]